MTINMTGSMVLVDPIVEEAGLLIQGEILYGRIVAAGPKCTQVAEGDKVLIKDTHFQPMTWQNKLMRLILESNIQAKVTE